MKYYVVSDVHGFYSQLERALTDKGYFEDSEPHKLIICGDLLDRGKEVGRLQDFIIGLMARDEVILIRGNHEDLMLEMLENFYTYLPQLPYTHHAANGTFDTAYRLSGMNRHEIEFYPNKFINRVRLSPYIKKIIPAMRDFYETENYVFVHGWIPCRSTAYKNGEKTYSPIENWREAAREEWAKARWHNGMAAWKCGVRADKTVVCGHFHTSWGHSVIEGRGSEWGVDSDFSPFYGDGIIAIDGATAFTKNVNCIIIED